MPFKKAKIASMILENKNMNPEELMQSIPAPDPAIAKLGLAASVGGGATAFVGGFTLNEIAMVVGMIVGVIGLIVQMIVQSHACVVRERKDRRDAEEHAARMAEIANGIYERRASEIPQEEERA